MTGIDLSPLFSVIHVFMMLTLLVVIAMICYVVGASLKMVLDTLRFPAGELKNADIVRSRKLTGLLISGGGAVLLILLYKYHTHLEGFLTYIPSGIFMMTKRAVIACGILFIVYGLARSLLYRVELHPNAIVICDGLRCRIIMAEDLEYIHWNSHKCTIISRALRPTTLSKSVFKDLHIKLRNYQKLLDIPDLKPGLSGN
jgi:hypothetical protein